MNERAKPERSAIERRMVRIPTADLINGWRQVVEREVDWICPECGGPRGEVHPAIAYDGRHQMHVDGWENPCGHVDQYAAVEQEGNLQQWIKHRRPTSSQAIG